METGSGHRDTGDVQSGPRLESWKEIASYLRVSVRTAQRWERLEGLPTHRQEHAQLASVYALQDEIEAWRAARERGESPPHPAPDAGASSIAVLPFVTFDDDDESRALAGGITEELVNALACGTGIRVVARTSTARFRDGADDVRAIGARLGVRTVLEGSVRRSDDRLRVTAQLIAVETGYHLFSRTFDERVEDTLLVEERIARRIVDALADELLGQERPARGPSPEGAAYEVYLRARRRWKKRRPEAVRRALADFEQAVALDPTFAPAHAGMADCLIMLSQLAGRTLVPSMELARRAATTAVELDPTLEEAHVSLALVRVFADFDWPGGESAFRRALALNGDHAFAHHLFASTVLGPLGRFDEAEVHLRKAIELDPVSPVFAGAIAGLWISRERYDRAVAACRRALELDPSYPWACRFMSEALILLGRYDDAVEAAGRSVAPAFTRGYAGHAEARRGRPGVAREIVRELESGDGDGDSEAFQIAVVYRGLEEDESTIAWLRRAYEQRSLGMIWFAVDPLWKKIRPHPAIVELMRAMHLEV